MIARASLRVPALIGLLGLAAGGCNLVLGIGELTNTGLGPGGSGGGTTSSSSSGTGGATSSSTGGGGGTGGLGPSLDPIGCGATCQKGDPVWAERFGGASNDVGTSIAVASNGDIFVAGMLEGQADLGSGNISTGCFVMKLDASGKHQWSFGLGNCTNILVAVGPDNAPSIAGVYQSGLFIGNQTYFGSGGFVAKLSSGGNVTWSRPYQLGGPGYFEMKAMAIEVNNDIALAGGWSGPIDFGKGSETATGENTFVVRLAPGTGNNVFARTFTAGGNNLTHADGVTFTNGGDLVFTGRMMGSINFGSGALPNPDGMFLVTLDSDGSTVGATSFTGATGQAIGSAGNTVIVAGTIDATTANFGGNDLPKGGFLARFDASLGHMVSLPLKGVEKPRLSIQGVGTVYVTGQFMGSVDLGAPLTSNGDFDILVSRFDVTNLAPIWSRHYGGPGTDGVNAVATDPSGFPIVTGYISNIADFGVGKLNPAGGFDILVARIQP
ncbi:Hypothetical protein A7982_12068 [Minicystis rosea]|nr:Hypothetical protein A7982_12068 [Minicystis rosea]